MVNRDILREGYFRLRRESNGLRTLSPKFEGLAWHDVGKSVVRRSPDGWKLCVYQVENEIEACVTNPAGEDFTFS